MGSDPNERRLVLHNMTTPSLDANVADRRAPECYESRVLVRENLPAHLVWLVRDPDELWLHENVLKVLSKLDSRATDKVDEELGQRLLQLMEGNDLQVARAAAQEFFWHPLLATSVMQRQLLQLLTSHRSHVRAAAAVAFEKLGSAVVSPEVTSKLRRLLEEDGSADARAAGASALGALGVSDDRLVIASLQGAFLDASPLVRAHSLWSIQRLCITVEVEQVREDLELMMEYDSDARVRAIAKDLYAKFDAVQPQNQKYETERDCAGVEIDIENSTSRCGMNYEESSTGVKSIISDLKVLIRVGKLDTRSPIRWQEAVAAALRELREKKDGGLSFSEDDRLQLAILETEFLDRRGDLSGAVRVLEGAVPFSLADPPEEYFCREKSSDADFHTIQRRVWLFMSYAWVRFYRFGDYDRARDLLLRVHRYIQRSRSPDRPWNGTRSRWMYYYAHCLRGVRRFGAAEKRFALAAELAGRRRKFKLERGGDPSFENPWAIVTAARIQGPGLGWNALLQGRLSEARQLLLLAQTTLDTTGEEFSKLFNSSLLFICARRAVPPSNPMHRRALVELSRCADLYARLEDTTGRIRCLHELCLGYLDVAEFADGHDILLKAKEVLQTIDRLRQQLPDSRWHLKYELLCVRYELTPLGKYPASKKLDPDLLSQLFGVVKRYQSEKPENRKLLIMKGLLHWVNGEFAYACRQFELASDSATSEDPVLRCEALLLKSWCIAEQRAKAIAALTIETLQNCPLLDRLDNEYRVSQCEPWNDWAGFHKAVPENAYLKRLRERASEVAEVADRQLKLSRERLSSNVT